MRVPERLVHMFEVVDERVIESPFIRCSSGRARFISELFVKIRAGGEIGPEDEKRINLMPPGWQETTRIGICSSRLLGEADRLILKNT